MHGWATADGLTRTITLNYYNLYYFLDNKKMGTNAIIK